MNVSLLLGFIIISTREREKDRGRSGLEKTEIRRRKSGVFDDGLVRHEAKRL